jgi:WD40 repeat protein
VRLWDLATGKEVRRFTGHEYAVLSVAVTPDGKYVVSGSRDKTVRLWELATGQEVRRFTGHEDSVESVAVTPDGKYVVSGSRGQNSAFVVHRRFADAGQVAAGHRTSKARWQTVGRTGWLQASAAFPITQSRCVAASQTQDKQSGW